MRLVCLFLMGLVGTACSNGATGDNLQGETDKGPVMGKHDVGTTPDSERLPPDSDTWIPPPCDNDPDGDGFGEGCLSGPDCDEGNPNLNVYCPPCENGIYPGCACSNDGSAITCYPGDPDLLGIGECKSGQQTCLGGYWTECLGFAEPVPEVCDGLDNDCDGETDEEVLSPCGDCSPTCNHVGAGPGKQEDFEAGEDNSSGVSENLDGFIVLDSTSVNMQYIWIANSGENTVSKLSTKTGKELGRYSVCDNPSRTSVDLFGDVWVGCRNDGGVAKINAHPLLCLDKNGDGQIQTSNDANGDGQIQPDERLPMGEDECMKFLVHPGGSCQRSMGVDKQNHAWTGDWNGSVLRRLHPDDGHTVQEIGIPAQPYGLVIDKNGIIWVSGRGGSKLVRVNPANSDVSVYASNIGCFDPYGITLDNKGRVWIGNCCCWDVAYRFDPLTGQWAAAQTHARPRGLVGNLDGKVYVANDDSSEVAIVDADSAQTVGYVSLGGGRFPVGMAADFDGFVWAVNQSAASATKIDAATMSVVGEFPVGSGPYTYSDMTGYLLHTFTNPTGFYQHLFGGWGLRLRWIGIIVDAYLPTKTYIKVRARSAVTVEQLESTDWTPWFGPFPPAEFPIDLLPYKLYGDYLQVEVALFSEEDGATPIIKGIEIQFDNGQSGNP
jgi:streptogramin lyase